MSELEQQTLFMSGMPVLLVNDEGKVEQTRARSEPWEVGGSDVILVDGRTGGYLMSRLTVDARCIEHEAEIDRLRRCLIVASDDIDRMLGADDVIWRDDNDKCSVTLLEGMPDRLRDEAKQ